MVKENRQNQTKILILALGVLLSQIGNGLTVLYSAIFFVNKLGLSATLVGLALGSASISGILGRFIGGSFADSPNWGRRKTLLISIVILAIAYLFLDMASDLNTLTIGNLLMGLGLSLFWPATEAAVADLTPLKKRKEAFALIRLVDTIGLGLATILGGFFLSVAGNYRILYIIDAIFLIFFFLIIYVTIPETYQPQSEKNKLFDGRLPAYFKGWLVAFSDRHLIIYVIVNIFLLSMFLKFKLPCPYILKNLLVMVVFHQD